MQARRDRLVDAGGKSDVVRLCCGQDGRTAKSSCRHTWHLSLAVRKYGPLHYIIAESAGVRAMAWAESIYWWHS
jgi:hypothetical protein